MYKDDLNLVKQLLGGNKVAFDQFYATYFPKLYRFCRLRVDDEDLCKDLVQQSLIAALRGIQGYRGEAALYTWLCQICRNEISGWFKRQGKKQARTLSLDADPDLLAAIESIPADLHGVEFDDVFDLKELVVTSLDQLPSKYSHVLEMKYIQGLSVEDISIQLEVSVIAVQSTLARARTAFREVFADLCRQASLA